MNRDFLVKVTKLLVFLLPLACSFGPMVMIGPLAAGRVAAAGLIGAGALVAWQRGRISRVATGMLLLWLLWLLWGFATVRSTDGLNELLSVALGLGAATAGVAAVGSARRVMDPDTPPAASPASRRGGDGPMDWLVICCRGWLLGWVATGIPAVIEITTGRHMPNYRSDAPQWIRDIATDAASYMVNPNLYAFFLISAMGMLMVGWVVDTGRLRRLYALGIIASPMICWFTNSRLVTLFTLVFLGWFMVQFGWARKLMGYGAVATLGLLVLAIPMIAHLKVGVPKPHKGSDAVREALYRNGWHMMWTTGGVGVGPGEFEAQFPLGKAPFDTLNGPHNPHSGLFEVGSQYGVLVLVVGLALLLGAIALGWSSLQRQWVRAEQRSLRWVLLGLTLAVVPLSFANSSWLDSSVAFAQLAGLALLANALIEQPVEPQPAWWSPAPTRTLRGRTLLAATVAARAASAAPTPDGAADPHRDQVVA